MSYGLPTKKVSDVVTTVKRKFGDESGVQLTDADIIMWVNDAQMHINAENHVLKAKSSVAAVAAQAAYSFSTLSIQIIESIHYDGMRIANMTFSQAEETISQLDPNSTLTDKWPRLWYEWAQSFTFWPAPREAGTIDVYYTKLPTVVTAVGNDLSLPDDYFEDVCNHVLQQVYEMDEDWEAMKTKAAQVAQSLVDRGERERTAQNMTYPVITVVDDYYGPSY